MRVSASLLLAFLALPSCLSADDTVQRARQLEQSGDGYGARTLLQKAATSDADTGLAYAEFLDRHRDPEARAAYEQTLKTMKRGDARRPAMARRLLQLDLLADDTAAVQRHRGEFVDGSAPTLPAAAPPAATAGGVILVPGPLRSFARMAALSPDLTADDMLPALARNIVTNGYQAGTGNEGLEQTEYLKLVVRYLSQARELEKLAGEAKALKIDACDSTQTADLLRVLGYRMRGTCGGDVVLETVNATRAFLTIDSGFPLAELEAALRTNRPFAYDYSPTRAPVLYAPDYWITAKDKGTGEFIDQFLGDPALCRLYLGLSKLDRETADAFRQGMPATRIRAFAHVLDFYGGNFQVRGGKAVVPGGARAAKSWGDLLGVPADQGVTFFEKLLARDDGWLASYYDAVARLQGPTQDYLTDPARMKRFYLAIKGKLTTPGPARPVFRANSDMMLLTSRLRLEADGRPHIPGGIDVWKNLFVTHPHGKYDGKLTKLATTWKEPDDLVEALFALCRKAVDNEPLKMYLALTDLNRRRERPLEPATVTRLLRDFRPLGAQYPILAEVPQITDATVVRFLDTAAAIDGQRDQLLKADAAGMMQALTGIWQILARQESIAPAQADATLVALLEPFGKARNAREVFDAGHAGVLALLKATNSPAGQTTQDRLIDLLAGASTFADEDAHRMVISDMLRLFENQRLISLQTIFDLSDHLESLPQGGKLNAALVSKLSARISETQLPRAALSANERNAMAFGYWTDKHIDAQRKLNLRSVVEKASNDPEKLKELRGLLTPFLRDTLVGLAYIHYAPPGAQILQTNALFVRSHDFLGGQGAPQTWRTTEVFGTGWPSSAGGRLVGSLVNLPYALAEAEQNFLIPSREQALIWGDLVPQMLVTAKLPRFWSVTPAQLAWVNLHLQHGESLVAEAALDAARRQQLRDAYARLAPPSRVFQVDQHLQAGRPRAALDLMMPSEVFSLARLTPVTADDAAPLSVEIRRLAAAVPREVSPAAISRAFGTPKPTLAHSYHTELMGLPTFPTLMGYSSRIMAESWESSLLYYAALAHETHLPPAMLNVMVPEWTQQTVERIFATHLEDWPALLRSLRLVGEEVRVKNRKLMAAQQRAAN